MYESGYSSAFSLLMLDLSIYTNIILIDKYMHFIKEQQPR